MCCDLWELLLLFALYNFILFYSFCEENSIRKWCRNINHPYGFINIHLNWWCWWVLFRICSLFLFLYTFYCKVYEWKLKIVIIFIIFFTPYTNGNDDVSHVVGGSTGFVLYDYTSCHIINHLNRHEGQYQNIPLELEHFCRKINI